MDLFKHSMNNGISCLGDAYKYYLSYGKEFVIY